MYFTQYSFLFPVEIVPASTPTYWADWESTRRGPSLGGRTAAGGVERGPPASSGSGAPPGQAGREPAASWTDSGRGFSTPRLWLGDGTATIRVTGWALAYCDTVTGRPLGSSSSSRPDSSSSGGGRPNSRPDSPSSGSGGGRPNSRPTSRPSSGGGRPSSGGSRPNSRPSFPSRGGRPDSRAQPPGTPARVPYVISWEEKTKQWVVSSPGARASYTVRSGVNTSAKCPADREEETWTVSAPPGRGGGGGAAIRVKCSPGY